jgi:hypothetical protein
MPPLIIKNKKHLKFRLPLLFFVFFFIAFGPLVVGIVGSIIYEAVTNKPCTEADCEWATIPWFSLLTIPIGGPLFLAFVAIAINDIIQLRKNKDNLDQTNTNNS